MNRSIGSVAYVSIIIFLNIILFHYPLFHYVFAHIDLQVGGLRVLFSVLVALIGINVLFYFLIAAISIKVLKLFTVFTFPLNAAALYFMVHYNIIMDKSMMGNVLRTDTHEVYGLLSPELFLYIAVATMCVVFLWRVRVGVLRRVRMILIAIGIFSLTIALLYLNAGTWLWLDRHAKYIGGMSPPWSYLINIVAYLRDEYRKHQSYTPLPAGGFEGNESRIVVLVIGESARAANFSLYGYERETNPELQKIGALKTLKAHSVATYTTASISAMLSQSGKDDGSEPLPNYLKRVGAYVLWRSDNSGEPNLKVSRYEDAATLHKLCGNDERCDHDEVLLSGLREYIETIDAKRVLIVLHSNGSHGPQYFSKYPKVFERFRPVCKSVDLKSCTPDSLRNAYDNTILYTDTFLSETIHILENIKSKPILFLYMSDHGESLGEYGLYLHGTPYAIAPKFQKEVPLLLWANDAFRDDPRIDWDAIDANRTYDNRAIFHTILGALKYHGIAYDKAYDILR